MTGLVRKGARSVDLTVVAIPAYFSSMGAEYLHLKKQATQRAPIAGDYERRDTIASLSMGVGSLLAPIVLPKIINPITPGRGKYGKALIAVAVSAAAATTIADVLARNAEGLEAGVVPPPRPSDAADDEGSAVSPEPVVGRSRRRQLAQLAKKARGSTAVAAVST